MTEQSKTRLNAQDVREWFEGRQRENARRRENPLTAADVRRRIEGRTEERRSALTRLPGVLSAGIGTALLVGAGAVALSAQSDTRQYEMTRADLTQQIERAEGVLAAERGSAGDSTPSEVAQEQIDRATRSATELADLQQQYAEIMHRGTAAISDDEVPGDLLSQMRQHQELFTTHIAPDAIPHAELALDEEVLDPRTPWFVNFTEDGRTVHAPDSSTWKVISVMPGEGEGLDIAWLNRSGSGQLYAWATAHYDPATDVFMDFAVGKTTQGTDGVRQIETGSK